MRQATCLLLSLLIFSTPILAQNPCEDETYLELKKKKLDEMSDREYEYFTRKDKECSSYSPNTSNKTQIKEMVEFAGTTEDKTKPMTLNIRGGLDILGDIQYNSLFLDTDDDLEPGYTLGADLIFIKTKYFDIGVGYEIQLERELTEEGGEISFNSFYVDVEANDFFARYGKNNFHGDDTFTIDGYYRLEGGWYMSIGGRYKYNDNSFVEIAYNSMMGEIYWDNDDWLWVEYDTFNISWGYYIDFDPNN